LPVLSSVLQAVRTFPLLVLICTIAPPTPLPVIASTTFTQCSVPPFFLLKNTPNRKLPKKTVCEVAAATGGMILITDTAAAVVATVVETVAAAAAAGAEIVLPVAPSIRPFNRSEGALAIGLGEGEGEGDGEGSGDGSEDGEGVGETSAKGKNEVVGEGEVNRTGEAVGVGVAVVTGVAVGVGVAVRGPSSLSWDEEQLESSKSIEPSPSLSSPS